MKNIPLFDLTRQHKPLKEKILNSWEIIYNSNSFTSGNETNLFEKKYVKFCNTKYALGIHSGTDSLIIALKATDIKDNDEVITTPCTFSASSDCIIHAGAIPVFANVNPITGNISPKKTTSKTKAILLVYLYGITCEMDEITKIAKKNSLIVIKNASHAHGSLYKGQAIGSFGLAGCFSLYPSKSLSALGNAGVSTSNNLEFIRKAKRYANHGIKDIADKYTHHVSGFNKLIDNLQSSALIHKLPILNQTIKRKIEIAKKYNQAFLKTELKGMTWSDDVIPSLYVYSFQTKNRDKIVKYFEKNDISTGIYYLIPLHLQPSMKHLSYKKGDFPNVEKNLTKLFPFQSFQN